MEQMISSRTDEALRARARKVVPGGMYGHMNAVGLPAGYPQFFSRGEGCHLWDADGRRYVDFMCSWGPIVLGHRDPAVEEAAERQRRQGDCLNGPTERFVELAERLVETITHADWMMFQKNGTDATTAAVMAARAGTGRRKILVARGAYHGAAPWCTPSMAGVTEEDRAHLVHFDFNDVASLDAAADSAKGDLAGILVSAFRHDYGKPQEMPDPAFARRAREICDAQDAALILDDVRAGFRLSTKGSWDALGVQPDLSAWSKAIANGYPLAAVAGNERFRRAGSEIFITGSFWMSGIAMAAGIATLEQIEETAAIDHMWRMGERLRMGLAARARKHGVGFVQTGPVQMPLFLFDDDADFAKGSRFCVEMLTRGVYMHPRHNMFLCAAHGEDDIDFALQAAEEAFAAVTAG